MTDQVLNILKFVLLGLLYLFFARVLWAVWSEVRTPVRRAPGDRVTQPREEQRDHGRRARRCRDDADSSARASRRRPRPTRSAPRRRPRASRGAPARLVVLEPAERRGMTVAIAGEITLGREPGCTIVIDDDAFVSQVHLRIFDYDGQPMVEDLGSTNGTYHNGVKLIGAEAAAPGRPPAGRHHTDRGAMTVTVRIRRRTRGAGSADG